MDITDGETMGGDGLPGPASRKLQGTTNQKRKARKRKAETVVDMVQVHLVTPEKQSALEAVLGPSLPVTGKPRAKGKTFKSAGAKILVLVSLTAAGLGLSIGLGHASSHNPTDGSHKTVQVQPGGRREEVGGQRAAGTEKGTSNIEHPTPNAQAGAEDGAGGEQETQTRDGSILAKLDEVSSALARLEQYLPGFTPKPAAPPALPVRGSIGRLRWDNDFNDVYVGGVHYDLTNRDAARHCIRYLVMMGAFDKASARHLENEINKHVREQVKRDVLKHGSDGNLRIQHYFSGSDKIYLRLHKELVKSAGRNGRFYLQVF